MAIVDRLMTAPNSILQNGNSSAADESLRSQVYALLRRNGTRFATFGYFKDIEIRQAYTQPNEIGAEFFIELPTNNAPSKMQWDDAKESVDELVRIHQGSPSLNH